MSIVVTNLGSSISSAGGATFTITTGATVPAGAAIYVWAFEFDNSASSTTNGSVTDAAGNTYTEISGGISNGSGARLQLHQATNVATLSSGSVITFHPVNTSGNAPGAVLAAFYATGLSSSPLDAATISKVSGTTNPATNTSGTSGTAGELFVTAIGWSVNVTASYSLDTGNGWSAPPITAQESQWTGAHFYGMGGGTQVNAGTGTKVSSPTMASGVPFASIILGLKPFVPLVAYKPPRTYLRR